MGNFSFKLPSLPDSGTGVESALEKELSRIKEAAVAGVSGSPEDILKNAATGEHLLGGAKTATEDIWREIEGGYKSAVSDLDQRMMDALGVDEEQLRLLQDPTSATWFKQSYEDLSNAISTGKEDISAEVARAKDNLAEGWDSIESGLGSLGEGLGGGEGSGGGGGGSLESLMQEELLRAQGERARSEQFQGMYDPFLQSFMEGGDMSQHPLYAGMRGGIESQAQRNKQGIMESGLVGGALQSALMGAQGQRASDVGSLGTNLGQQVLGGVGAIAGVPGKGSLQDLITTQQGAEAQNAALTGNMYAAGGGLLTTLITSLFD